MANYLQIKPKPHKAHAHGSSCNHAHADGHGHDHGHDHQHDSIVAPAGSGTIPHSAKKLSLTLTAMDCPTEANLIRQAFAKHPQIHLLEFDLINRILSVTHTLADEQEIHRTLISISLLDDPAVTHSPRNAWLLFAASGVLALGSEVLSWADANLVLIALMAIGAVLCAGTSTLKKGWLALRHLNLNINLLMSVAVVGALLIGQFPEAAVVIFLFTLAEKIEAASLGKARNAIAALQAHAPESAYVLQADGSWLVTASRQIVIGQTIRVRPGELIALDGVVSNGNSSVNQATITGESMPVDKSSGDLVFAGSLNQAGSLEYKVTAASGNTTLDRIATTIQQAQQQRAPVERMIDAFAKIYTPCVFAFAILTAVVPALFFGAHWHDSLYQALVLLVIACPCALVIATPVTVVSALTYAARRGILIKGGQYLEQARHIKTIAFDKTGTLTNGKPGIQHCISLTEHDQQRCWQLAASLNALSQHPIATAMMAAFPAQQLLEVANFASVSGRGVTGTVQSQGYALGNQRLMQEQQIPITPQLKEQLDQLEAAGNTVVILADVNHKQALALFSIADSVRATSLAAITQLHAMGIATVMLTGDNRQSAYAVAQQVGIKTVHAELLPQDKFDLIAQLQQQGKIAMVGDGVNDAPALARADLGITLGAAASATALEVADVALMQSELTKLAELIQLSQRCSRLLMQNIGLALGIKVCFLVLTLLGHANLWMAVFADMGASLLVIFNGLRMLKATVRD